MDPNSRAAIPIAVFLSGGGRSLANLLAHQESGDINVDFRLVISSRENVRGLEIADQANIPTRVVRKSDYAVPGLYRDAMFDPCREVGAELVVMAGFLKHVTIPKDFENRVINIHPSLIPKFSGQGMYGMNVHQAVVDAGERKTGCTVHYVDNIYDNGPVILQGECHVDEGDTPQVVADKVFALECEALPQAIRKISKRFR
ncbi:MAG: phosphoribosylglycinamide formyltransferase [Planctomycetota bacterium]